MDLKRLGQFVQTRIFFFLTFTQFGKEIIIISMFKTYDWNFNEKHILKKLFVLVVLHL